MLYLVISMSTKRAPETTRMREAIEEQKGEFRIDTDLRTQEILFRLAQEDTHAGRLAKKVWEAMRGQIAGWEEKSKNPDTFQIPREITTKIDPLEWNALQYEIENERIRYGAETPRVKEFEQSRDQLNGSIRKLRERYQWESLKVGTELMTEEEKKDSKLFAELNTIVQDLVRELGFTRPVTLEITRSDQLNAFVLSVAKEGGIENDNTVPLRFFVHAGLIEKTAKLLKDKGKVVTRDHLAVVLGHELAHLKQPEWHADKPSEDEEERQRYEYDADAVALEAMDRAGYNPQAGIEFFDVLHSQSGKWQELLAHEMTRSHPLGEARVKELWQAYGRPDYPFFSAQKKFEPLSEDSLQEADRMLRKELNGKLDKVTTLAEWEDLIASLESDPKMTLWDVELYEWGLKQHKEVRAAISGAVEELEAGTGLSEAILHLANHYSGEIKKFPADEPIGERRYKIGEFFQKLFPESMDREKARTIPDRLFNDIIEREDLASLRKEFDPRQVRKEEEQKFVEFVYSHLTGNQTAEHQQFKTVQELFDVDNPAAVELWRLIFGKTEWTGTASREIKEDPKELIARAKEETVKRLAKALCFGVRSSVTYKEEEIDVKEAFLKILEEVRSGKEPLLPDEARGAFLDARQIEALKRAVAQRVGGYIEQKREMPSEPRIEKEYKPPRTKSFGVSLDPQNNPPRVSEEMLEIGTPIPTEYAPFQRILARYFQRARSIFERTLHSEMIKQEFGVTVGDNPQARELLFKGKFYDNFFDVAERGKRITGLTVERLRAMPELFEYLRFAGGPASDEIRISEFFLRDEDHIRTLEDAGQQLERIRIMRHHPKFARHYFWQAKFPPQLERVLPKVDDQERNMFGLKKRLFRKIIRWGITREIPALATLDELKKGVRTALKERAQTKKLPQDFLWAQLRGKPRWHEQIGRALGKTPYKDEQAQWRAINQTLSEEFMRLMADDVGEMEQCKPDTINVSKAYFESTPYAR